MELDTGRHGITDRFRRAGLRLWHVQVFEYNLFDYEAFSAVRLMVREAGAITGLVLDCPLPSDSGANSAMAATVATVTRSFCISNLHSR